MNQKNFLMRVIATSLLLLAVNAAAHIPALEQLRAFAPGISIIIAVYLLIQAAMLRNAPEASVPAAVSQPAAPPPPAAAPRVQERPPEVEAHLVQFLGLLQEKGRFLDFVMDDIAGYDNEQVGAAARVVHQGCSKIVRDHLSVAPVHSGEEGSSVTLESGYNPHEYRAVGKLAGSPPFQGTLLHKGWKASKVDLPRLVEKQKAAGGQLIIAPAEVEVKSS
jgi:hypothetical protein